jgi:DNA invertase Pin-like site-specific DNA recombinase
MRCAIYCRFSSDQQRVASLADQERVCRQYAQRQGWEVCAVYRDAAISGAHDDRPDYQLMLAAARRGAFDILVAEDLDRLNRRLEHSAALYNQLQFVGIALHTVSRGAIDDVQVGIGGLMGEMFLKNLREKTRRGLEGRVYAGKSGGGLAYGYKVSPGSNAAGEPLTGEREIDETEAAIVREIFQRYAAGEGPRLIAADLNARGVPAPRSTWSDTTIRGHAKRGTGILNNTLYVGKMTWGRQRYLKNPSSGRRNARMNDPSHVLTIDVPHLRIIDQDLWDAVKERQAEHSRPRSDPFTTNPLNDSHRPKFLLSGLLKCGVCGGGYTIRGKDRYGCASRANKGACANIRTIKRQDLERRILDGLKCSLVTPELVAEFVAAFTDEWNRLQANRMASARQTEKALADVERRINSIMDAIEMGITTATTKSRLLELEAEQNRLTSLLKVAPEARPAIHPNLAQLYRQKVARLEIELNDPAISAEAKSVLRSMIEKIVIHPGDKRGEVQLELHGELANILAITVGRKNEVGAVDQLSVVAGARSHLYRTALWIG